MLGFNRGAIPGEDFTEFGRGPEEGIEGAKLLEKAGADMLNADNGSYDLIRKGKKPVIIELQDDILKVKDLSAANSNFLRDAFKLYETPIYLGARVVEISAEGVVVEQNGKQRAIPAESVITSIGYVPAPLKSAGANCHVIGDAAGVGNLKTVIWGAYDTALKI